MTTTPRLGITELEASQAVPETTVNEAQRILEQGAGFFGGVLEIRAAPPGSPVDGDTYIVGAGSGAWAGKDDQIAIRVSTAWAYIEPAEGMFAWNADDTTLYRYSSGAWGAYSPSGSFLPLTGGTLSGDLIVPADAYDATSWNGNNEVPTKNDIRDKIEAIIAGIPGTYTDEMARDAIGAALVAGAGVGITVDDAGDTITIKNTVYRIGFFFTTPPTSSEVLALHVATDAFTFPANFASPDSKGAVGTNPAGSFVLDVQKNGVSIGTITISTGGAFTFATASGTSKSIAAGDVIKVVAPGSADASIANVAITLRGTV